MIAPSLRPFLAVQIVAALALIVCGSVQACRPAGTALDRAEVVSGQSCAAAVMVDDDVAATTCRACRARGEVAP